MGRGRTKWVRGVGACQCCGFDAYVLEDGTQGNNNEKRVSCDECRIWCRHAGRCKLKAVSA